MTVNTNANGLQVVQVTPVGARGPAGQGVPAGGTTGQVLAKASSSDYDTEWVTGGAGGVADWANVTNKPATFPPSAHVHVIADVTGLQSALDGKQPAGNYATSAQGALAETALQPGDAVPWSDVTGKPTSFPPSAHGHAIADVSGLQSALDGKAATSHTHADATASAAGFMSSADKTKLNGVASGATANATDAQLRDRSTHTGTQTAATISDFNTAADARIAASDKVSSNVAGITGADQITNVVSLTQAEYNAIPTKNASTLYVIAG